MFGGFRRAAQRAIVASVPAPVLARSIAWHQDKSLDVSFGRRTVEATAGYTSRDATLSNLDAVLAQLRAARVPVVLMPRSTVSRPVVVISSEDGAAAESALSSLLKQPGWNMRSTSSRPTTGVPTPQAAGGARSLSQIDLWRRVVAGRQTLSTSFETVSVLCWEPLPAGSVRIDGGHFVPGTLHRRTSQPRTTFSYLEPADWDFLRAHEEELRVGETLDGRRLLEAVEGPIDVVYTWVDGNDTEWRRRKAETLGSQTLDGVNSTADSASRYVSRDELKFSLRSLELYAPWVRHIYLVTAGQVPAWLDRDNPRITVVDHREIFTAPEALPVFNSHAIESQLHHIPGLSERYIYMNDDVFFARPVAPSNFFTPGGLSKYFVSEAVVAAGAPTSRDLPVVSAAKNNRALIEGRFGRVVSHKFKHTPHPQRRSVLDEMERELPDLFDEVSRSRIRHPEDYSIASALHHYWAEMTGRATKAEIHYEYVDLGRHDVAPHLAMVCGRRDLDVFCLNDVDLPSHLLDRIDDTVRDFLQHRFPLASSFEII